MSTDPHHPYSRFRATVDQMFPYPSTERDRFIRLQTDLELLEERSIPAIKFKRLHPQAILPARATDGAAGYDLFAVGHNYIAPGETKLALSGWAIELPEGWECQVRSRSGMAGRGVTVANGPGTIDSDYRGEVGALLTVAMGHGGYGYGPGDRIAQLVFKKVPKVELVEVETLSETTRGARGYGSTGL